MHYLPGESWLCGPYMDSVQLTQTHFGTLHFPYSSKLVGGHWIGAVLPTQLNMQTFGCLTQDRSQADPQQLSQQSLGWKLCQLTGLGKECGWAKICCEVRTVLFLILYKQRFSDESGWYHVMADAYPSPDFCQYNNRWTTIYFKVKWKRCVWLSEWLLVMNDHFCPRAAC